MIKTKPKYITDRNGRKTAVIIPIKDWNMIKEQHLEIIDLEEDAGKEELKKNIKVAVEQLNQIKKRKMQGIPARKLLNDL